MIPSSVSSTLTPNVEDDLQRILGADEDCSSSDQSYIGQSNVIASSSADEDHPVVLTPLEVVDLLAWLAGATSGHRDIDDSRMDPLFQKAWNSRRQMRKHSNIFQS